MSGFLKQNNGTFYSNGGFMKYIFIQTRSIKEFNLKLTSDEKLQLANEKDLIYIDKRKKNIQKNLDLCMDIKNKFKYNEKLSISVERNLKLEVKIVLKVRKQRN